MNGIASGGHFSAAPVGALASGGHFQLFGIEVYESPLGYVEYVASFNPCYEAEINPYYEADMDPTYEGDFDE